MRLSGAAAAPRDPAEILRRALREHPGWGGFLAHPRADHTPPDPSTLRAHGTGPADAAALAALGVTVEGGAEGCLVLAGAARRDVRIAFGGHRDCVVVLGAGGTLQARIAFEGDHHLAVLNLADRGAETSRLRATFRSRGGALFVGQGGTVNEADFLVEGPDTAIILGDDAMVSRGVQFRTSDSHGIVSLDEPPAQLNPPAGLRLGPHVWVGQGATIGRGTSVGRGAIVALNAVVTRDVPPRCLVGGVPMRVLRENVTWTRSSRPGEAAMREAAAFARRGDEAG